jgi:hypothetical protein
MQTDLIVVKVKLRVRIKIWVEQIALFHFGGN